MNKKFFLFLAIFSISLVFAGCGEKNEQVDLPIDSNAEIMFFYGRECPHCKVVEKYIEENKVAEKIKFSQAEVYHNKDNSAVLKQKATECGIAQDSIGVPFLWTEGKCYMGDEDIIKFFEDKIGI
ncbi:MAG: hypothetical protein A2271_02355 [Candidatus Moranbacteria bacterium RIFOXYA12_FULL_35_19]|nr:MAG: hypothetical protein UR78_C0008G0021 [Candidatus Moranbacteria bacterium GW2011_GWF2_35_39]OGI35382.1 MAG: hypothetical protein A2271_02355 [Candidatus Moranbacteria bacterium RIFOXYA12_FULL_35_19]